CLLFVRHRDEQESIRQGGEHNGMGNPDHNGYAVRNDGTRDVRSDEGRAVYETGPHSESSDARVEAGGVGPSRTIEPCTKCVLKMEWGILIATVSMLGMFAVGISEAANAGASG